MPKSTAVLTTPIRPKLTSLNRVAFPREVSCRRSIRRWATRRTIDEHPLKRPSSPTVERKSRDGRGRLNEKFGLAGLNSCLLESPEHSFHYFPSDPCDK